MNKAVSHLFPRRAFSRLEEIASHPNITYVLGQELPRVSWGPSDRDISLPIGGPGKVSRTRETAEL